MPFNRQFVVEIIDEFVHDCFRHQHEECRNANRPTSNVDFRNAKLDKNMARDKKNVEELRGLGGKVFIIWECELKDIEQLPERSNSIDELSDFFNGQIKM
jgi:DNA mismatch endonuclease (patch repair protein)